MPRYKGIGMPKAKKKAVVELGEAQEESPGPPAPSEPPAPPSPDSKQVGRKRPAQSPGMGAIKQAAYAAKKASRAACFASIKYWRAKIKVLKKYPLILARQHGIMRSTWQKTGNKKAFSHLQRWEKAELEKATSVIPTLEALVHALALAVEAKDAAKLLHRDARITRLSRLLRMQKRPGRRWSACGL